MASFTLHIQYVDRPPETRTFANRDRITIGRDIGDIALRDSQVSGRHGEITFQAGVLRFVDLGSTNGSFLLDGRRLSTIEMTPGMAIRVGNSLLTVQMIDSPLAGKGRTLIAGGGMPFGMPAPGMPAPGMPAPGTPAPGTPAPGMPAPGMPAPGMPAPGMPAPGMPAPGVPASRTPAPRMRAPGAAPAAPVDRSSNAAAAGGGLLNGDGQQDQEIAYAPTSAMPAAMPSGFAQPVAQPPGAPPPGFPKPPTPPPIPEAVDDGVDDVGGAPTGLASPAVAVPESAAPTAPAAIRSGDFATLYKQAWEFLKPVVVPSALIIGGLTVPIALASGILGLVPVVGPIVVALLALAQAVLMPLAIAALTRFLLGVYLNHPVDWMTAWKEQLANAKMVWLSFFVAGLIAGIGLLFLIIPGILLGSFVGVLYFCEGKRMVDINLRNLEITKQDPLLPIVTFIVVALAVGIGLAIPAWILGLIPFVGAILAAVLQAAVMAVVTPFMIVLSIMLYFRIRRRFEGGEPEAAALQMLIATAVALPQETDNVG